MVRYFSSETPKKIIFSSRKITWEEKLSHKTILLLTEINRKLVYKREGERGRGRERERESKKGYTFLDLAVFFRVK